MSGHSKFANIKHKKERNDAAKGKVFTVIGREIAVAVKEGGATITAAREVKPNAHNNPITAGNVPASRSRPCLLFVCLVIILKRFLVRELRSPLAISGL